MFQYGEEEDEKLKLRVTHGSHPGQWEWLKGPKYKVIPSLPSLRPSLRKPVVTTWVSVMGPAF